ncbi:MAG: hypothetical protein [Bacteriophage sp.]|nr:MAG: hypothetical protein [Bacteriophage sp.]
MSLEITETRSYTFDKIPMFQKKTQSIEPTSGTKAKELPYCESQLDHLKELMAQATSIFNTWKNELDQAITLNELAKLISPKIYDFNAGRIKLAETSGGLVFKEIEEICNVANANKIITRIPTYMIRDVGLLIPKYLKYCQDMLAIAEKAATYKIQAKMDKEEVTITSTASNLETIESIPLKKFRYRIEFYIILPSGEKIDIGQYIQELLYTRLFDETSLPIFSVLFLLPEDILYHIKMHNENLKWFVNLECAEKKNESIGNEFVIPEVIFKDIQLIPIDPIYNSMQSNQEAKTNTIATRPFKIDLVSHKDVSLNATLKSRVFNNVRMLDVITLLTNEIKEEYKKRNEATVREVKVSISPPDNTKVYEQILIEPGSFNRVIQSLQEKYGIYNTGVRVCFDSVKTNLDKKGNENITEITILGKGDTAPGKNSLKDVIIDIINPNLINTETSMTEHRYNSGQYLDTSSGTSLIRTYLPYVVARNNSDKLINGEALRVMHSSSNDHLNSHCDTDGTDVNMQKIYWSKFDNPFNLTQLQDSIREGSIRANVQVTDINIVILSNNQNYRLKFYGDDDKVYTGDYRLSELKFYYKKGNNVLGANEIDIHGVLSFINVPTLKVNGTVVSRKTYGEKIESSRRAYQGGVEDSSLGNYGTGSVPTGNTTSRREMVFGPPFKCGFPTRKDFHGQAMPIEITDEWKMSSKVTFKQVYDTNNSSTGDMAKVIANTLAQNYVYFVNAQRFAVEVIDPVVNLLGSLGEGNKVDSWLRLTNDTSPHTIALAVDSKFGSGGGLQLADRFLKLAKSSIEFDQLILESKNNEWLNIHISKVMNGTNRKEIKVHYKDVYKKLNLNKVKSSTDLAYDKVLKVCY